MEKKDIIPILIVVAIAIVAFSLDTITGKEIAPTVKSVTISPNVINVIKDRDDISVGTFTIKVEYIGRIENEVQILRGSEGRRWLTWQFDNCGRGELCSQAKSPATLTKSINIDTSDSEDLIGDNFKPGLYYARINDRWGIEIAKEPFRVEIE